MSEESYIQQLADYIRKNLSKGYTAESLKIALENQGYTKLSIERAMKISNEQLAASAPVMKEKPVIKYKIIKSKATKQEKKLLDLFK